jgi:hypothetical protein
VSQPPPTAEIEPIGPTDASTTLVANRRARRGAVLFATVLAAVGLVFGTGAAAVASAPVSASATAGEEAAVDETAVASRRAETRLRRARGRGHHRARLSRPRWRRPLALLSPLVAAIRGTPRRGPPLLTA